MFKLFILLFLLFTSNIYATVLPSDYSLGDTLPYTDLNQILATRYGDLKPIDVTRNYSTGTEDLGTGTYQWKDLYMAGKIYLGTDVNLYREQTNVLRTDDNLTVSGNILTENYLYIGALDVNLHRTSTDNLKTDDNFIVNGNIIGNSKVGIGTASPSQILHIYSTSTAYPLIESTSEARLEIKNTDTNNYSYLRLTDNSGKAWDIAESVSQTSRDLYFNNASDQPIMILDQSNNRVRISTMNVSDFNWGPDANSGELIVTGVEGSQGFGILALGLNNTPATNQRLGSVTFLQKSNFYNPNDGLKAWIEAYSSGSGGTTGGYGGELIFATRSDNVTGIPTERMRITDDGDVLISDGKIIINSDTNLYRVQANVLKTDDNFTVASNLDVDGNSYFEDKILIDSRKQVNAIPPATSITVSGSYCYITDAGASGTSNINTINGGETGMILYLECVEQVGDIILIDGTGNLKLNGNFDMTTDDMIMLIYNGSYWLEISRSSN